MNSRRMEVAGPWICHQSHFDLFNLKITGEFNSIGFSLHIAKLDETVLLDTCTPSLVIKRLPALFRQTENYSQ